MARRSDGELEVMLSDRQLMLLFMIGVLLLAAFFAMGFLAGRHWAAADKEAPAVQKEGTSRLPEIATPRRKPAAAPPAVPEEAPVQTAQSGSPSGSSPEAGTQAGPKDTATKQAEPPALESAAPVTVSEPPSGLTFLQVTAQNWPNAELVAGVLKRKGFPTQIAPGPTADVFRVLVGPVKGQEDLAKTREALRTAGFNPIVRKY